MNLIITSILFLFADEYITSGFLGLQYAVDKSFIEIGRTTLENQLPKVSDFQKSKINIRRINCNYSLSKQ